jgi:transglutaminase-like putative cysteine protease
MKVKMNASVFTKQFNPFDFAPPTRQISDKVMESLDFYIENHTFLKYTKYTTLPNSLANEFIVWEQSEGVFEFLMRMNAALNKGFVYERGVTDVKSSALDFFKLKKGVCQDYVHLFLALCRANKIPARYVSGYLNQDTNYTGTSMMHAWAEAHVPTVGWIGFDPTNDVLADENYVKVAHGADYNDCSPIKGILFTNGENKTKYEVSVRQNQQ